MCESRAVLPGADAVAEVPSAASADGSGVDSDAADIQSTVMRGVLQVDKGVTWPSSIPRGSKAIVTMRVMGSNSKGPLATLALPIDAFPLDFTISRRDLRDVPDFVWASEDLYVKADVVTPDGRVVASRSIRVQCVIRSMESPTSRSSKGRKWRIGLEALISLNQFFFLSAAKAAR